MVTRRVSVRSMVVGLSLLLCTSIAAQAVRVLPASLSLDQRLGTQETYLLTVLNDTDAPEELVLYVGDWQRLEDGEHDWGLPVNSARWILDRSFAAGETLDIVYAADLPTEGGVAMEGTFEVSSPQASGVVSGPDRVGPETVGDDAASPTASSSVWIGRRVESVDADGWATVRLTVQFQEACEGLVVYETASERVDFVSIDAADGRFDAINRSNAGWVSLSHDRLVLQPDESRDVTVTVTVPEDASGTYWSAVFVQSQPQASDQAGTRVVSIYRTAIKVYVTASGTEFSEGRVVDVQVAETDPFILYALFENTGNVELVVTGEAQVIDRTGQVIREYAIDEFKVLPGAQRIVTVADAASETTLSADIYQAVVSFEYGGDSPVVGVRGFRVR